MSIRDKITEKMEVGKQYRAGELAGDGINRAGVFTTLNRMSEEGVVRKVQRGLYEYVGEKGGKPAPSVVTNAGMAQMSFRTHLNRYPDGSWGGDQRVPFYNRIGVNFNYDRDTYLALGYKRALDFQDYYEEFKRGNIAKRIINAPPKATWRNPPKVKDADGENGAFAKAWKKLAIDKALYKQFERADIKARVGQYGVMLFGLPGRMDATPGTSSRLLYVNSLAQNKVKIKNWDSSPQSERFGLPTMYELALGGGIGTSTVLLNKDVHWSRTLHISEDLFDDNVYGTPVLEAVFNNLFDLLKVIGGSAESVWKTFDRGMAFILDPDSALSEEDETAMDDEIKKYIHGQQRFMRLQGAEVKNLGAESADPRGQFQVIASVIAGTTGIPQRILFGSERGQLASQADERNWNAQIKERQKDFAEPDILRPFIERMVGFGVLPKPNGDVEVEWPDLTALSESEQVQNGKNRAQAARNLQDVTYITDKEKRVIVGLPGVIDPALDDGTPTPSGEVEEAPAQRDGNSPKGA